MTADRSKDPTKQLQAEAAERWPTEYSESRARLKKLSASEQKVLFDSGGAITTSIAGLFINGETADSPQVQELIGRHYRWVDCFWTPSQASYIGLGELYVQDQRFAQNYEKHATGLAEFMRRSMTLWACENLT